MATIGDSSNIPGFNDVNILNDVNINIKNTPLINRKTKNKFIIDMGFNIFYSRDLDVTTSKHFANQALEMAYTFYNELIKRNLITEKFDEDKNVYYVEY